MNVTVDSRKTTESREDLLAIPIPQIDSKDKRLPPRLAAVDGALSGAISAVLRSGDFSGKPGESLMLYPDGALPCERVLVIGLGPEADVDADGLRRAAGIAAGAAHSRGAKSVAIAAPRSRRIKIPDAAQALAEGAVLGSYRFDSYKSVKSKQRAKAPKPQSLTLRFERPADVRAARAGARNGAIIAESQNLARQLSNEPPNELPPIALAKAASKLATEVGLRCRVFDVAELKRRKMGAILAVGSGSTHPPRMVVLEHNPPPRRKGERRRRLPTVCVVGKGVTFDSGGISIKPSPAMDEMKHDMSGAASTLGVMRACALLKLPLHVVGIIGAVENMPSGDAYRPGDILRSASKKTIEILNTDAEGRVVLADALHFAHSEFEPVAMVDMATLTGACVIALGPHATGMFDNDEKLAEHLRRAGETTSEQVWRMPLWDGHRKAVESAVADVKNAAGREASSSTAAAFLQSFVGETPWAHLDIAGTGWTSKTGPYQPRGATGVGVRLVVEALRSWKDSRIV